MTKKEIAEFSAQKLAFIGDAVHTLYVRNTMLTKKNANMIELSKNCNKFCKARAQQVAFFRAMEIANDEEKQIAIRGRNSSIHHRAKNSTIDEYRHATGYEALLGFLFLTEQKERLNIMLDLGGPNYVD